MLDGNLVCLDHFPRRMGARLLAYVALHPKRGVTRLRLARDIWPDAGNDKNRLASLRNDLAALRAQLAKAHPDLNDLLLVSDVALRLNPAVAATDLSDWEARIAPLCGVVRTPEQSTNLKSLVEQGEAASNLLASFRDYEWLMPPRYNFAGLLQRALLDLARERDVAGDLDAAREYARRAVKPHGDPELSAAGVALEIRLLPGRAPSPPRMTLPDANGGTRLLGFPPLPPIFTAFFGREDEIDEVLTRIQNVGLADKVDLPSAPSIARPLLMITGTAGVGKTRFAQEILRRARPANLASRVAFVPLATVRAAADIPGAVAAALGVTPESSDSLLAQLVRVLRLEPTVLALDNLEHLLPAGRAAIETLLRALLESAPSLVILGTSRERLGADFEQEVRLPTLPVPGEAESDTKDSRFSLAALLRVSSVQLFEEQARRADPDFRVSARNAASVAALCRRLDGLPLAIELVAARAKSLTPGEILKSLDQQRAALDHGRREEDLAKDDRHRTLRDAVEWSHSLLPETIRTFFNALSVFRGGFTLESAAAVCTAGGDPSEALFPIESLQDRHFLRADDDETTGAKRFRLLETMREFGRDQLSDEERTALARRHADHFLAFAEEAKRHETGRYTAEWLDRQETEHANLMAAMDTFETTNAWVEALQLTSALSFFWRVRSHSLQWRDRLVDLIRRAEGNGVGQKHSDGHYSIERSRSLLTAMAAAANTAVRLHLVIDEHTLAKDVCDKALRWAMLGNSAKEEAIALRCLGYLEGVSGNFVAAKLHYEAVVNIGMGDGNHAHAIHSLGSVLIAQGDIHAGCSFYEKSLELSRRIKHWHCIALTQVALGNAHLMLGEYEKSVICVEEGRATYQFLKAPCGAVHAAAVLSNIFLIHGDATKAERVAQDTLTSAERLGMRSEAALVLRNLGHIALKTKDVKKANHYFRRTLDHFIEVGHSDQIVSSVFQLASVAAAANQWREAARLWSAVDTRLTAARSDDPTGRRLAAPHIAAARAALGDAFDAAYAEGAALPWEDAIELARSLPIGPPCEK